MAVEKQLSCTINVGGHLLDLSSPVVMGILNATPDSFYAASRVQAEKDIAARADQIIAEGAAIIDVGGCSTRPGSTLATEKEEMERLRFALSTIRKSQPEAVVSVDTFRPDVARMAVEEYGAAIVNDISEGRGWGDETMHDEDAIPPIFKMVAHLKVPYILTSVKSDMKEMLLAFSQETRMLHNMGLNDIILDPGFGFGKDLNQNYIILSQLSLLKTLGLPVLVGVSRKSMATRLLGCNASEALNATTALHAIALMKGAAILRAHDVKEAVETCRIMKKLSSVQSEATY